MKVLYTATFTGMSYEEVCNHANRGHPPNTLVLATANYEVSKDGRVTAQFAIVQLEEKDLK